MSMFAVNISREDELIQQLERGFSNIPTTDREGDRSVRRATATSGVGKQGSIVTANQVKLVYNYFVTGGTLVAAVAAANAAGITPNDIIIALLYFVASIVDTGAILVTAAVSQAASAAGSCVNIVGQVTADVVNAVSSLIGYFTVENINFGLDVAIGACQGVAANAAYTKSCQYINNRQVMFQEIADTINSLNAQLATLGQQATLLGLFQGENLLLYTPTNSENPQPSAFLSIGQCAAADTSISEKLQNFKIEIAKRNEEKMKKTAASLRSAGFNPENNQMPALTPDQQKEYCANQTIRDAIAERRRIIVTDVLMSMGLTSIRNNLVMLQTEINERIQNDDILKILLGFDICRKPEMTESAPPDLYSEFGGRRTKGRKTYRKPHNKRTHKKRHPGKTHHKPRSQKTKRRGTRK